MLNCMAGICSNGNWHDQQRELDGLKRFADACHEVGTKPCAVSVLTSKTPYIALAEYNGRPVAEQVLWYAEAALSAGIYDLACSPHELHAIRAESRFDQLRLNIAGLRLPGSDLNDQARVATPLEALQAGASRLVIGREITNGPGTISENFLHIVQHIAPAFG